MSSQRYTYSGDYEDLLDYILETYNPFKNNYSTFYEWLQDVRQHFAHHWSKTIGNEMEQFWKDNFDKPLGKPSPLDDTNNRNRVFNSVIDLYSFKLGDVYKANAERRSNYKDDKSYQGGIRREINKLVKDGLLVKTGKGEYRIK